MKCWLATVCTSVNLSRPSDPCLRPTPDCFIPPIGESYDANAAPYPSLTLTVPAWMRDARRRPFAAFFVQTEAFSP